MINNFNRQDEFGFYQVGEYTSYSKVEALEVSKKTGKEVIWNFNNEILKNYNWKIEPPESFKELYGRRAKQIREKYDYIVLWYSGGADSNNMVNSFIKNNLHIDEIAQYHNYEADGTWDSYFNEEVAKVAAPNTQQLIKDYPNIKHRLFDQSKLTATVYNKDNNHLDFIYKQNNWLTPNAITRSYFRENCKDWQDIIDSGKTLCFVWGIEKPILQLINGKYCVRYADVFDNCVSPRRQQLNREWEHDEFFYWSPEMPDLVAKQGHTIMKHLRSINQSNIELLVKSNWLTTDILLATPNNTTPMPNLVFNNKQYYLPNNSMHTMIYPWWDPTTFSNGKTPSVFFSARDVWWLKDHTQKNQNVFIGGIKYLTEKFPTSVTGRRLFQSNPVKMFSPPYWLE